MDSTGLRQASIGQNPGEVANIAAAANGFALDLFGRLPRGTNLIFSPLSIFAALAMTCAGARGETAAKMGEILRSPGHAELGALLGKLTQTREGGHILGLANSLWMRRGLAFLPEFLSLLREHYAAQPQLADFTDPPGACSAINGWVEDRTERRIRDLVKPHVHVKADTLMVLVNAIYFRARWLTEFSPIHTRPADFCVAPQRPVRVPMMHMESAHEKFLFSDQGSFKLLRLPYRGGLSMILALPQEADGVDRLDVAAVVRAFGSLSDAHVRIDLPVFRIETACELRKMLSALGMAIAFDPSADFSGMTADLPVKIGEVVHKAFIDLNEEGTEAAAATAVVADVGAFFDPSKPKWVDFRADHPFLFFIQDWRSKSILFMGRVVDPA